LLKAVNNNSKLVLFADHTSVIVSNPNLVTFKNDLIFSLELNVWFKTNLLFLNYNKASNSLPTQVDIRYKNKYIVNDTNTRFLGKFLVLEEPYVIWYNLLGKFLS
jgi:hypothetical protein